MATKILLFLSKLHDDEQTYEEKVYQCPDGGTAVGYQTNEAPVKYLLRAWPEVSEILCIVTPEAADARECFQSEIQTLAPQVAIREISYAEGADFTAGPLRQIMEQMRAGDELLLDTTGGFRNSIMDMLLASRALTYIGVRTAGAVYSNYYKAQIEDITHLFRMFDLIGGMQEFSSFGSTRTLRAYYGTPAEDARIEKLLSTVEQLLDRITLCRTEQLEALLAEFNAALTDAENCDDAMMKMLLPAFQKKYGTTLNIPSLIRWCVRNDMIQQALTIYKELIPAYLLKERPDLLTLKPGAPLGNQKEFQSTEESRFMASFYKMGEKDYKRLKQYEKNPDVSYIVLGELEKRLSDSYFIVKCSQQQIKNIFLDYFYIRALRNMTNHANDTAHADYLERFLTDHGYPHFRDLTSKDVAKLLLNALDHLRKENYQ